MIDVTVRTRMVVVVGRGPIPIEPAELVGRAAEQATPLVVLAVGGTLSRAQEEFVERAIDAAFDARVELDTAWVPRPEELLTHVASDEHVTLLVSSRERRRIRRTLVAIRA